MQQPPGKEKLMSPAPKSQYRESGSDRLKDTVMLITGGDSGIGRAVAVAAASEGADIACSYLCEHEDAQETKRLVETKGRRCLLLPGDIGDANHCSSIIKSTVRQLGKLSVLINNAAEQSVQETFVDISPEQLERTFRTNIFSMFYLSQAALPHLLKENNSSIICTTSVTAYRGSDHLIDYASTKGAIVSFVRSLSKNLAPKVRVNGVAPGPVRTPLISSTFPKDHVASFGDDVPLRRPAEPNEIAPAYIFLASSDASFMTGQVIHPNGGEVING